MGKRKHGYAFSSGSRSSSRSLISSMRKKSPVSPSVRAAKNVRFKFARKLAKTLTFTKKKKCEKIFNNNDYAGAKYGCKKWNMTSRKANIPKGVRLQGTYQHLVTNKTQTPASNAGQQGWLANEVFLYGDVTLLQLAGVNQAQQDLKVTQSAAGTVGLEQCLLFEGVTQEVYYTNNTGHTTFVVLYDYYYRQNCPDTMLALLTTDFTPVIANASQLPYALVPGITTPGVNLFDNTAFCHYCKIKKITRFSLAPGETYVHKKYVKYNKMWTAGIQAASNLVAYKGWSVGSLAVFHGPVVGGDAGGNDFGLARLYTYEINRYRFRRGLLPSRPHLDAVSQVTPISGNELFVDEQLGQFFKQGFGPENII